MGMGDFIVCLLIALYIYDAPTIKFCGYNSEPIKATTKNYYQHILGFSEDLNYSSSQIVKSLGQASDFKMHKYFLVLSRPIWLVGELTTQVL